MDALDIRRAEDVAHPAAQVGLRSAEGEAVAQAADREPVGAPLEGGRVTEPDDHFHATAAALAPPGFFMAQTRSSTRRRNYTLGAEGAATAPELALLGNRALHRSVNA